MKRLLASAALFVIMTTAAHAEASGMSCLSKGVVNMADNYPTVMRVQAKVLPRVRTDLNKVLSSINQSDRDEKIRTLLDRVSKVTAEMMKHQVNEAIEAATEMTYNGAVRTIAFIESNAKNPRSPNILQSKKTQVTMAVTQVIGHHVACVD
jgi:hypothetical protein